MSRRTTHLMVGLMLALFVIPVFAQDTFEASVSEAGAVCSDSPSGTVCYGAGDISATFTNDVSLDTVGDFAVIASLSEVTVEDGVAVAKIPGGQVADTGRFLTIAAVGNVQFNNVFDPATVSTICTGANLSSSNINILARPNTTGGIAGEIEPREKFPVSGITGDSRWFRIEFNNDIAWVENPTGSQAVGIDCDLTELAIADANDVRVLYENPLQQMTLTTTGDDSYLLLQTPVNSSGRILVNGVEIKLSGAAAVTANDTTLTVTQLLGVVNVRGQLSNVSLFNGEQTSVALTELSASDAPSEPQPAHENNLLDIVNSLINGQPIDSAGGTIPNLSINAGTITNSDFTRVDLSVFGDAGACAANGAAPEDIVFAVEINDNSTSESLAVISAAIANAIDRLNLGQDRYGVIAYRGRVVTAASINDDFDADSFIATLDNAFSDLSINDAGIAADYGQGISSALSQFKQAGPGRGEQTIVLITDGTSAIADPTTAIQNADAASVKLVTVLTNPTATLPEGLNATATAVDGVLGLNRALENLALSLTHAITMTDVTLTFTPADGMTVVESLLTPFNVTVNDEVQWSIPAIHSGQVVTLPIVLTGDGEVAGTVGLDYTPCGDGANISFDPIEARVISNNAKILNLDVVRNGGVKAFGADLWLVDTPDLSTLSAINGGFDIALRTFLGGGDRPLYSLDDFDGSGDRLSVFSLQESGPYWLYLQSVTGNSQGAYSVRLDESTFDEALITLEQDGPRLNDRQEANEGRIYDVAGQAGDIVTVRFTGASATLPFDLVSLDGARAINVFTNLRGGQWVSVQSLQGEGPYRLLVYADGDYGIEVDADDTLSNDRGALVLGRQISQPNVNNTEVIARYSLEVNEDAPVIVSLIGGALTAVIRDSDNQLVPVVNELGVNSFNVQQHNLNAGNYTVYLRTIGNYSVGVNRLEGELQDVLGTLKGTLLLNSSIRDSILGQTPVAVYNLSEGVGKPFAAGETLTVFASDIDTLRNGDIFVQSADGLRSEIAEDFLETDNELYISVHRLEGEGPYRLFVTGESAYTITANRGNLLSNDKGALILGQNLRDSSRSPELIQYTLAPQLGKQLVEGDIVTVSFVRSGQDVTAFDPPQALDGKGSPVRLIDTYVNPFQGIFIGVYELTGQQPYRLSIPNIGAYTIGAQIGNTLVKNGGAVELGEDFVNTTQGVQLVRYTLDVPTDETRYTVEFQNTGRTTIVSAQLRRIYDAEGNDIIFFSTFADNTRRAVFTAEGTPPYTFEFAHEQSYRFQVREGDELFVDKGVWFLGDAEVIETPQDDLNKILQYSLEITEPGPYTIQLDSVRWIAFDQGLILDPDGDVVDPRSDLLVYQNRVYDSRATVYDFEKVGTYQLILTTSTNLYDIRVTPGDTMTVDKGNIFFGEIEVDKLADERRFAEYTINASEGDTISVQFEIDRIRRNRSFLQGADITLFNANNTPIGNVHQVIDDGYLLQVYELTGPGPYTLLVQPERVGFDDDQRYRNASGGFRAQEEYRLIVEKGDSANRHMGQVGLPAVPEEEGQARTTVIEGEVVQDDLRRTLSYDLVIGDIGDITVDLSSTRPFDSASLFVVSPDGRLLLPDTAMFVSTGNVYRQAYENLAPGTYKIHFDVIRTYKLTLTEGNVIQAEFGMVTVNPAEPPVEFERDEDGNVVTDDEGNPVELEYEPIVTTNALQRGQVQAEYTIDAPLGQTITVQVGGRQNANPVLVDARGLPVFNLDLSSQQNNLVGVYQLQTQGPYSLYLNPAAGNHTVRVDEGNLLIADFEAPFVNPFDPPVEFERDADGNIVNDRDGNPVEVEYEPIVIENRLQTPAIVARYPVEAESGTTISVLLNQTGRTPIEPFLLNGDFDALEPVNSVADGGSLLATFSLSGPAPYDLVFAPPANYSLSLTEGDILTAETTPLPVGILEERFANELIEPARLASHTIDIEPGRIITLQLENRRREFIQVDLRDANSNLLLPELFDFQRNVNNVYVYSLSGQAPYTLTFPALEPYQITLVDENLLRVNQGFVPFAEEVEGELEDPSRVVTYSIDGKRDQTVTIQLQEGNQPTVGEFRDANGRLWETESQVSTRTETYNIFRLGGPPPYELTFNSDRGYALTVTEGNVLRTDKGVAEFDVEIRDQLESPARTAIYEIPAQTGSTITVQLQDRNQPAGFTIFNADRQSLPQMNSVTNRNSQFAVVTLAGPGPYTIEFDTAGQYRLFLYHGNVILADLGVATINEAINSSLQFPALVGAYTIERQSEQVISIALQVDSREEAGELLDANGQKQEPSATIDSNRTRYQVFTLQGVAPYTYVFRGGARYSLLITDGNVLRADKGVVRFGNTETDRLRAPEQAAIYIVDAQPGQTISLRLSDNSQPLEGELLDADGMEVLPLSQANVNRSSYTVFEMTGSAPYTFTFFPRGNYQLELTEGDVFRAELGTVAFGEGVRNRLILPTRIASYTINTTPDQIISITLTNTAREFIVPVLTNASGEALFPQAQVFNNNNEYIGVFNLTGDAPFTLEFQSNDAYTLRMQRGNITEVELNDVGPRAAIPR